MSKTSEQVVDDILERWTQWHQLYPPWYIDRHFILYDSELPSLIAFLKKAREVK